MLYRIIGEEISTHRRVEIPNWEAPSTATAKRLAAEIGVKVLQIEPMNAKARVERQGNPEDRNAPSSNTDDSLARGCPRTMGANTLSFINCPTCHELISAVANSCPGCGFSFTPNAAAVQKAKKQKAEQANAVVVFSGVGISLVLIFLCSGVLTSQPSPSPAKPEVRADPTGAIPAAPVSRARYYRDSHGAIVSETETENKLAQVRSKINAMPDNAERAYFEGFLQALETEWARMKREGPIDPTQAVLTENRPAASVEPLPETKRRKIFYELAATQDAGVGDERAYRMMMQKYNLPEKTLLEIAYEGAKNGWPMP